jgi:hypothetical protein
MMFVEVMLFVECRWRHLCTIPEESDAGVVGYKWYLCRDGFGRGAESVTSIVDGYEGMPDEFLAHCGGSDFLAQAYRHYWLPRGRSGRPDVSN